MMRAKHILYKNRSKIGNLSVQTLGKSRYPTILPLAGQTRLFNLGKVTYLEGCPRGVMVKAMNCGIVVRKFVLQSRYYVHFRANTLGKGMNPLILPPAMGK